MVFEKALDSIERYPNSVSYIKKSIRLIKASLDGVQNKVKVGRSN